MSAHALPRLAKVNTFGSDQANRFFASRCWLVLVVWLMASSLSFSQTPDVSFETQFFESIGNSPHRFVVEVTFLDPKLVSATEQTYFFQIANSYQSKNSLSVPIMFPAGAKSAKVDIEINATLIFPFPELTLTLGPSPNSGVIAETASNFVFMGQSVSLPSNSYLFIWEDPPFRTAISKLDMLHSKASGYRNGIGVASNVSFAKRNTQSKSRLPTLSFLRNEFNVQSPAKAQMSAALTGPWAIGNAQMNSVKNDFQMLEMAGLNTASFDDLPKHWPSLDMMDVLFIPAADMAALGTKEPQRAQAIRDRIAVGGQLIVYSCGSNVGRRKEILPALNSASPMSDRAAETWTAWQLKKLDLENPTNGQLLKTLDTIQAEIVAAESEVQQQGLNMFSEIRNSIPQDKLEHLKTLRGEMDQLIPPTPSDSENANCFAMDLGKGNIIAIDRDLADFDGSDWIVLQHFLNSQQKQKFLEVVGNSVNSHTVRGVGEPPKLLFLFLVSAFAIFVGPVCFLILLRIRRQNWILLLVPAVSFLSSILLLTYGLIVDGLDYRINQVSSSYLDAQNNCVVTHAENAIFAGRTPQPIEVDLNTFLKSNEEDNGYRYRGNVSSHLEIGSERNEFSGGDSRARTKHVMTTMSVRETASRFKVQSKSGGLGIDSKLIAENNLGLDVEFVIARNGSTFYYGENIRAGETTELKACESAESEPQLIQKLQSYNQEIAVECLASPPDARGIRSRVYSNYGGLTTTDQAGQTWSQRALLSGDFKEIGDGQFWLITRENPWAPDLNPNPFFQYRIHFIYGNW